MPADRQTIITTFRDFPARLEALVAQLPDDQLDRRAGDDEWTVRQIVHHVADAHCNTVARLKLPLTEANPTLKTYDQDGWANLPDSTLPLQPSLLILRGIHERLAALLESLTEEQWQRPAVHPAWGAVTVESVAQTYADHCDEHLAQIEKTLQL